MKMTDEAYWATALLPQGRAGTGRPTHPPRVTALGLSPAEQGGALPCDQTC